MLDYLKSTVRKLPLHFRWSCEYVLDKPEFLVAPGGASHHHAYLGGLLQHTGEVVQNVELLIGDNSQLNRNALITAAVWHDLHKIYEYRIEDDGSITKLPYRSRIGHVVGSYAEFHRLAWEEHLLSKDAIEEIGHIMLAHHGRLEWRSPVEPETPEAFILHTADMMSARGGK